MYSHDALVQKSPGEVFHNHTKTQFFIFFVFFIFLHINKVWMSNNVSGRSDSSFLIEKWFHLSYKYVLFLIMLSPLFGGGDQLAEISMRIWIEVSIGHLSLLFPRFHSLATPCHAFSVYKHCFYYTLLLCSSWLRGISFGLHKRRWELKELWL